jgi:hypothetical protein
MIQNITFFVVVCFINIFSKKLIFNYICTFFMSYDTRTLAIALGSQDLYGDMHGSISGRYL